MKTLIILLLASTILSCSKKDDSELSPATKCSISNDSVNSYLQSAKYWKIGSDSVVFENHSSMDSVYINGVKKLYFVLDCGKNIYVGNLNETQKLLHIEYIGVKEFHFNQDAINETAIKY